MEQKNKGSRVGMLKAASGCLLWRLCNDVRHAVTKGNNLRRLEDRWLNRRAALSSLSRQAIGRSDDCSAVKVLLVSVDGETWRGFSHEDVSYLL